MNLKQLQVAAQEAKLDLRDYLLFLLVSGTATSNEATLESSTVAVSGSVAAGYLAATLTLSDDFTGSINGISREVGTWVFSPTGGRASTTALPYVITTGSIKLDVYTQG